MPASFLRRSPRGSQLGKQAGTTEGDSGARLSPKTNSSFCKHQGMNSNIGGEAEKNRKKTKGGRKRLRDSLRPRAAADHEEEGGVGKNGEPAES